MNAEVKFRNVAQRSYAGQERQLKTGDVLLFSGKGFSSWSIRWATGSKYSHAGLVYIWDGPAREPQAESDRKRRADGSEERVYCLEARGKQGVRLALLSQVAKPDHYHCIDYYENTVADDGHRIEAIRFAFPQLGKAYDHSGILRFAKFIILSWVHRSGVDANAWRKRLFSRWFKREHIDESRANQEFFCSELVAAAYKHAGIKIDLPPSLTSPADLTSFGPPGEPYLRRRFPLFG